MFKNLRQSLSNHTGAVAAAIGSAATFSFFLLAYPYHLMRREQMNLFLFDTDYIRQTYHGSGWMARFVCDFLDQFFGLPVVGPLVITLLLVAVGSVTYKICRKVLGKWPSLATGEVRALESIKGDKSDTYHSWSSSSRWFVFPASAATANTANPTSVIWTLTAIPQSLSSCPRNHPVSTTITSVHSIYPTLPGLLPA